MNFGARWDVVDVEAGKSVIYENLESDIQFDCGIVRSDTPMSMILEFIVSEGDPGDMVFVNGSPMMVLQKEVRA